MERLTRRFGSMVGLKGRDTVYPDNERKNAKIQSAIVRLTAYEDTGLEPEEVTEYQRLCDSYVEAGLDAKFIQFCIDATRNGLSINRICELAQAEKDGRLVVLPPNDPLTLAELREMDGDPVWVSTGRLHEWCIVHSCHSDDVIGGGVVMTRRTAEKRIYQYANYGKTWLAYRRKPEEREEGGNDGQA